MVLMYINALGLRRGLGLFTAFDIWLVPVRVNFTLEAKLLGPTRGR